MIETLGSRLRQLRDDKHLQQEQVANLIGVNKSTISLYENDMRQPSYETLVRLATLYRVSTDYLLGCASARMIDVSGLTADEVAAINQIVTMMTAKNQYIEENEQRCRSNYDQNGQQPPPTGRRSLFPLWSYGGAGRSPVF